MQPKSRILVLSLSALIAAMLLAGCGGGDTGKTWFNLPSVRVGINESGQAKVAGITLPAAVVAPAQVEALTSADVQQIEARIGYGGIEPLLNGESLPRLTWDQDSLGAVQELVAEVPGIPYTDLIAGALPRLRQFGIGVTLDLPGDGANLPEWRGETPLAAAPEREGPPSIGPLDISSVTFDEAGNAKLGDLALADLGVPFTLPPNIMSLLASLGVNKVTVNTDGGGLNIALNDQPLPSLAYDAGSIERTLGLVGAFMPGSPMLDTIAEIAPLLPGADLRAAVTFDGVPAGELALDNLSATINADGTVRALGLPIPGGPLLPPDLIGQLQDAGLENVRIDVADSAISLANNGQPFPRISWSPEGEALVTSLAPTLGLPANLLDGVLGLVGSTNVGVSMALPAADGSTGDPAAMPETAPFAPVDLGGLNAPTLRLNLTVDSAGSVTSIGNIEAADLSAVGLPAITLPSNILDMIRSTGANQLQVKTSDGRADILLDGSVALSLDYDTASLKQLLDTLKPFLGVELLDSPAISQLIDEVVLPLAPGADLEISITLP